MLLLSSSSTEGVALYPLYCVRIMEKDKMSVKKCKQCTPERRNVISEAAVGPVEYDVYCKVCNTLLYTFSWGKIEYAE